MTHRIYTAAEAKALREAALSDHRGPPARCDVEALAAAAPDLAYTVEVLEAEVERLRGVIENPPSFEAPYPIDPKDRMHIMHAKTISVLVPGEFVAAVLASALEE